MKFLYFSILCLVSTFFVAADQRLFTRRNPIYTRDIYDPIYTRDVYDSIYTRDVYDPIYTRDLDNLNLYL
jgi:hypothetical protein